MNSDGVPAAQPPDRGSAINVVMIPSVSGGIGHIARTAVLARALERLQPSVRVEYLLDCERLRPFNIDAALATGYRVHMLPARTRQSRDAIARSALGHADIIVDDTMRHLIPLRECVRRAAWFSIPLFPMGDELFMEWPHLMQTDGVVWAYPPVVDFPPELDIVTPKLARTGPFLELDAVPGRAAARATLGFSESEDIVAYAPRGMPFGREFGERVLGGVIGAVAALRDRGRRLRLVLLAVRHVDELRAPGVPLPLPEWVTVVGLIPQAESLLHLRAADIAVTEGTSTTHEAAGLGTPIVMVPGPIPETWTLGTRLKEHHAAHILWIETVTPQSMAQLFGAILDRPAEHAGWVDRARDIVGGGGGVDAAARFMLDRAATYWAVQRAARSDRGESV